MRIDFVRVLLTNRRMHIEPRTFSEILALWKTHGALAIDMNVPKCRARQWRVRGSVHPRYWPRLIELVEQRFGIVITPRQLMLAAAGEAGTDSERTSEAA